MHSYLLGLLMKLLAPSPLVSQEQPEQPHTSVSSPPRTCQTKPRRRHLLVRPGIQTLYQVFEHMNNVDDIILDIGWHHFVTILNISWCCSRCLLASFLAV